MQLLRWLNKIIPKSGRANRWIADPRDLERSSNHERIVLGSSRFFVVVTSTKKR